MKTTCPTCRSGIPVEDINVSTDLALCRACGKTLRFSEIVDGVTQSGPDLSSPPSGVWYERLPNGFCVGATTRSWMALFVVPFTCVWAGGSLTGIYGTQIASGRFNPTESLFGIPFLLGSCALIAMSLMSIAGKISVTLEADRLSIFTGVGSMGWTRNLAWSDFRTAREEVGYGGLNWGHRSRSIAIEGKRKAALGSMWNDERRYFVLNVLRRELQTWGRSQ